MSSYNVVIAVEAAVNCSSWSEWSSCDTDCDGGKRQRNSTCLVDNQYTRDVIDNEPCNENACKYKL